MDPVLCEVVPVTVGKPQAVSLEASRLGTVGPGIPPGSHEQETEKQPVRGWHPEETLGLEGDRLEPCIL